MKNTYEIINLKVSGAKQYLENHLLPIKTKVMIFNGEKEVDSLSDVIKGNGAFVIIKTENGVSQLLGKYQTKENQDSEICTFSSYDEAKKAIENDIYIVSEFSLYLNDSNISEEDHSTYSSAWGEFLKKIQSNKYERIYFLSYRESTNDCKIVEQMISSADIYEIFCYDRKQFILPEYEILSPSTMKSITVTPLSNEDISLSDLVRRALKVYDVEEQELTNRKAWPFPDNELQFQEPDGYHIGDIVFYIDNNRKIAGSIVGESESYGSCLPSIASIIPLTNAIFDMNMSVKIKKLAEEEGLSFTIEKDGSILLHYTGKRNYFLKEETFSFNKTTDENTFVDRTSSPNNEEIKTVSDIVDEVMDELKEEMYQSDINETPNTNEEEWTDDDDNEDMTDYINKDDDIVDDDANENVSFDDWDDDPETEDDDEDEDTPLIIEDTDKINKDMKVARRLQFIPSDNGEIGDNNEKINEQNNKEIVELTNENEDDDCDNNQITDTNPNSIVSDNDDEFEPMEPENDNNDWGEEYKDRTPLGMPSIVEDENETLENIDINQADLTEEELKAGLSLDYDEDEDEDTKEDNLDIYNKWVAESFADCEVEAKKAQSQIMELMKKDGIKESLIKGLKNKDGKGLTIGDIAKMYMSGPNKNNPSLTPEEMETIKAELEIGAKTVSRTMETLNEESITVSPLSRIKNRKHNKSKKKRRK